MIEGPIRKLRRRIRELEAKLSDARAEINVLRRKLRDAQIGRILVGQTPKVLVDAEYRKLLEAPKKDEETS